MPAVGDKRRRRAHEDDETEGYNGRCGGRIMADREAQHAIDVVTAGTLLRRDRRTVVIVQTALETER